MTKGLNLMQSNRYQNVDTTIDLLCLGKHTNDYIDGMSPVEWAILKQKIKIAERLLDNGSEPVFVK